MADRTTNVYGVRFGHIKITVRAMKPYMSESSQSDLGGYMNHFELFGA
jgi:hypothetical protein|tara:strand:- start:93 stop:236 length:144 start_codon:yes stop_codon:yes gene_type:complete